MHKETGVLNSLVQAANAERAMKEFMSDTYEDIIYLSGGRAKAAINVFNRDTGGGCEGLLQYLSHYHVPGSHPIRPNIYGNKHSEKFEIAGYLLTIDKWVPYVSLQYKIEENVH